MLEADRRILGFDIALVEFGWPVGMPLCRPFSGGLWEVRSNLTHGRMVLLHEFVKKNQKTPQNDLEIAGKRQKEVEQ